VKAVEQVKPSSRSLNDTMDINKFVKIKIIDWKDSSLNEYVNGIVFSKTVSERFKISSIENPSILLLTNILDRGLVDYNKEML